MADTSPARGRWASGPVPPEPRSIVGADPRRHARCRAGGDALAAARGPGAAASSQARRGASAQSTLLAALLDFLPPEARVVELAGADGDLRLAATGLGARLAGRAATTGRRAAASARHDTVLLASELSDRPDPADLGRRRPDRRPGGVHRLRAGRHDPRRFARRRVRALRAEPVGLTDDELSRLGVVLVLRRTGDRAAAGGSWPPITSGRSPATSTATSSGWGRRCWRPGTPRRTGSSISAGASCPSSPCGSARRAGDFELEIGGAPRRSSTTSPSTARHRAAVRAAIADHARRWPPRDASGVAGRPAVHRRAALRSSDDHRAPTDHPGRAPSLRAGAPGRSRTSCAPTSSPGWRRGGEVLPGRRRLRGLGRSGDRERDPRRTGPGLPRRAGPGQDADGAPARRAARRVAAGRPRRRAQRRPARRRSARPARAIVDARGRCHPDRLAAARPPLRREAGDPGHHDRRPDRRDRPDQGGRGSLPVRRADPPLRPHPARQPRDRRDQRAARPRRADPGRPAQHPRGARRPDPRLRRAPAARPVRRRLGQPGGLHVARPDHHPAQGPPRIADPDALSADARARDGDRPPGEAPLRRRGRDPDRGRARRSWRSSSPS